MSRRARIAVGLLGCAALVGAGVAAYVLLVAPKADAGDKRPATAPRTP